ARSCSRSRTSPRSICTGRRTRRSSSNSRTPSSRRSASRPLARQNAVVPAGILETTAQRVPLRVTGSLDGVKAVAETPVEANGRVFRVGDIATVTHGFADPPDFQVRQKGKAAIGLGVVMAKGANILDLGPAVAGATAQFMAAVPQGFDLEQI